MNEPFEVEAGPDGVICNDPLQLNATVVGAATDCAWILQMDDDFGDGWNGAQLTVTVNATSNNYTCVGDQTIQPILVTAGDVITLNYAPGTFENEVSYILYDDQGNIVFQAGPDPPVGPVWNGIASCDASNGMVWEWSPVDGLSDPNIADPTVSVTSPTEFFVTASILDHPLCNATDSVTITLDPGLDPGLDSLVIVCATPPSFQLIDMLAGTPAPGGAWTDANGDPVADVFDPVTDAAGIYTYTVVSALGCVGTADLENPDPTGQRPQLLWRCGCGPGQYHLHAHLYHDGQRGQHRRRYVERPGRLCLRRSHGSAFDRISTGYRPCHVPLDGG